MSSTKSTGRLTPESEERDSTRDPMTDAVVELSDTLDYITNAFAVLEDCMNQFIELPSRSESSLTEIKDVTQKIKEHDYELENVLSKLTVDLQDDINQQVIAAVKAQSSQLIREEAAKLVKEQVDEQIVDHLPQSLQDQADESKRQLDVIKVSLKNSEARMANSFIQSSNTGDPLAVILTPSGNKSPFYPRNTRFLFGYDLESAKALSKDYELAETDDLMMNFRQFLKHIGTNIEVVVSP